MPDKETQKAFLKDRIQFWRELALSREYWEFPCFMAMARSAGQLAGMK